MKKVLITGSSGFIGRHIAAKLKTQNIEVVEFCRKNHQDVTRAADFDKLSPVDTVFHLAAVSGYENSKENISLAYQVNVLGTINVLEYCRKVKAKLIFSSTYVYGKPYEKFKKESDNLNPTTHYSFTKFLGEEMCRFYNRVFGVETLILRTANVYGPSQDEIYIVPVIATHLLNKKPLILTKPEVERSFIYIDDLVEAYIQLAQAKTLAGDAYNVGPDKPTALKELVALMIKISGTIPKISYSGKDRPSEADKNRIDTTKIKAAIDWQPKISLEEGLKLYFNSLANR